MKKTSLKSVLSLQMSLILAALTLLSACRKDQDRLGPAASRPGAGTQGNRPNGGGIKNSDGTSDPGGGTGLQGRAFESYIRDPKSMRGFHQYLKPIFDQYDKVDKEEEAKRPPAERSQDDGGTLIDMFAVKKWFLLPMKLDCVNKDVIGLTFAGSEIDVLACQTKGEVWIDESKTRASNDRDFAKLLLHEFVVQIYTMRFQKMSEIMRAFEEVLGKKMDFSGMTAEQIDVAFPAEPIRKLGPEDYEIIRRATDWLFEKGASATYAQFHHMLDGKVWDKRFSNEDDKNELPKIEHVKTQDVLDILAANDSAGIKVDECRAAKGKFSDCSLSVNIQKMQIPTTQNSLTYYFPMDVLTFTITSPGGSVSLKQLGSEDMSLSTSVDNGKKYYEAGFFTGSLAGKKVGDRLDFVTVKFTPAGDVSKNGMAALRFSHLQIMQPVITKIAAREKDGQKEVCYSMMMSNSSNPWLNNFVATSKGTIVNNVFLVVDWFGKEPLCYPAVYTEIQNSK